MRSPVLYATIAILGTVTVAGSVAALADHRGDRGFRGGPFGGARLMETFDTNNDGSVGVEEARAALQERLTRFDGDGDGQLSLQEYEPLFNELRRPRMVDAFQRIDDDGDGAITTDEVDAHVDRLARRLDRNGDGEINRDDRRRGGRWHRNSDPR